MFDITDHNSTNSMLNTMHLNKFPVILGINLQVYQKFAC